MGVWIETEITKQYIITTLVTPFVGVWIETRLLAAAHRLRSVTPFVGVWIETWISKVIGLCLRSHTLRGCVD